MEVGVGVIEGAWEGRDDDAEKMEAGPSLR
jgi:hypothetical protein